MQKFFDELEARFSIDLSAMQRERLTKMRRDLLEQFGELAADTHAHMLCAAVEDYLHLDTDDAGQDDVLQMCRHCLNREGRLTLTGGVSVPTSDVTGATEING
jgi:hypothetical protein